MRAVLFVCLCVVFLFVFVCFFVFLWVWLARYKNNAHTDYMLHYQISFYAEKTTNCRRMNLSYSDEVEKVERELMVKDVRNLAKYLYATHISLGYSNILHSMCNGCIIDHPSQSQHSCLETFDIIDGTSASTDLYIEAEAKVSKFYLKLLFTESCKTLWLNSALIDFEQTLQEFLQSWMTTEFIELENSMEVKDCFTTAADAAATKIGLLEERFMK